jgi:beta-galactosidase
MKELLYGAAYYDEYMPYDRLEKDVAMMKKAGINTVRIAESTQSGLRNQRGVHASRRRASLIFRM